MAHIIIHTLKDGIRLFPFLFIVFLIIEYIEHKFNNKSEDIISKSGKYGPIIGALFGLFPQCGFSVIATNLYITRIISLGTLIAVYLSTSDEMLPILISNQVDIKLILKILLIKFIIGMFFGLIIDFIIRKLNIKFKKDYSICKQDKCGCEHKNIFVSSLIHTVKILSFLILVTFVLNVIMTYLGKDFITKSFLNNSFFSPFLTSLVGLIPNCSASVILTELYINNGISFAGLIAGLLTGSGVGILVLLKSNRNVKENLFILALIYLIGSFSGIIINLIGLL